MAQKDALGQDALLLTSPAERVRARLLVLAYAELVNAEFEYLAVSADTTEADLKQRRELLPGGNVGFSDSPPVRAAVGGRILLLDGLERAERNVLPTLNNLLENREMSLDDGRFLISRRRYDSIAAEPLRTDGPTSASLWPVHDLFRVVAIASPCPPFAGRALDPPLRSRFQALLVPPVSSDELAEAFATLPGELAQKLITASETISELERQALRTGASVFFSFSGSALATFCAADASAAQAMGPHQILQRVYPPLLESGVGADAKHDASVRQALSKLGVSAKDLCSDEGISGEIVDGHFRTPAIAGVVAAIREDLTAGRNVLLLGSRGAGKSALVRSLQDATWRNFALHRDLSARDLLQRRVTDPVSGVSGWADQPCVAAARAGNVVVLDGVHRLPAGVLVAAVGRLCTEREMDLPDGTRLVDAARCAPKLPAPTAGQESETSRVAPLPKGFRMVALAEPGEWLTPEIAALFSSHVLPELTPAELEHVLGALVPAASQGLRRNIADIATLAFASQSNGVLQAGERAALRLSPRVLLRLARRAASESSVDHVTPALLHDAMMSRFLPGKLQDVIDSWLRISGRRAARSAKKQRAAAARPEAVLAAEQGDVLRIGDRELSRRSSGGRPELVPSPREFFESAAAMRAVSAILRCEHAGEHAVLLLGNQGVGKNVAADRALELMRAEREYVQLHRDTTVSSLTVLPVLEGGHLRFEDAPLVRAARHGRVCVLDEADKAPTEVVVILKALIEDGELVLADGRRLLGGAALRAARHEGRALPSDVVPVHEDFRLWVLANRPGYPFHGNAFFRECGDAFAAVALDNPDIDSETALLHHCASTYPWPEDLRRLARAFADLRRLAEEGSISYPYSMREAVAVARHLEKFPNDTMSAALANVLAFEAFDAGLRARLAAAFEAQGFTDVAEGLEAAFGPVSGEVGSPRSTKSGSIDIRYLAEGFDGGESTPRTGLDGPKHGEVDPTGAPHVGGNRWAGGSGGSDTAGLGGRGGPYRLWDGNPVHQVSEKAKSEVSEEARAQARALAHQAWRERLAEIEKMDERMWNMYHGVFSTVEPQVGQLQAILQQARDRQLERTWLRNRSDGELDDARLVEGVAGDRLVFKKRGRAEVQDAPCQTAKDPRKRRICFVMDCSGSMYRFNGLDGRLNRMLEATCLILEAMQAHLDRYDYAVLGHSGETPKVEFVEFCKPPTSRGDRLKILQQMLAHTQFCLAGDNTIEATHAAIDYVLDQLASEAPSDEVLADDDGAAGAGAAGRAFVVVLSDANFRRYGMDPLWWSEALTRDPRVECHAVMLGSLGDEARSIQRSLPPGRGHIVFETALLPATFRSIFEQAGLCRSEL